MTNDQLLGWIEYDQVEPIGGTRTDLQTAIVASTLHNQLERVIAVNTIKYRPKFKKIKEFLVTELLNPSSGNRSRQPMTIEQFRQVKSALKSGRKPQTV